jgi:RHS repeat-associated protein
VSGATFREYDYSGHLLEETDGEGNPQADYIYLGDRPIAVLQPDNGNLYWIQGDRLDTPQMATDGSQAIAWTGAYQPFGKMSVPSTLITQDLRMPGQEFDAETGWYHNGFRDYMPDLGRYLETDVIGLAGGLNTYAYAGGNPLRVVDPLGLDINLFPGDTAEYAGAQWYTQSAAAKGTVNVYAHGGYGWWDDPSIARAQNGDPTAPGDINKMVNLILSDPNYTNIGSVYLRICHGAEKGKTRLSLAQQIKDALAAKGFKGSVYAWSGQVETAPPGGTSVQLGIGPYLPLPPTKF